MRICRNSVSLVAGAVAIGAAATWAGLQTKEDPMMEGLNGWKVEANYTISESIKGYVMPGVPDGMGALKLNRNTVRVLVNHELNRNVGYVYELANGTKLTGARVSYIDLDNKNRKIRGAGPAYDTIYDRAGKEVTSAGQINESEASLEGLDRLCSAVSVAKGTYGFVDDIFFTGEETSWDPDSPSHPHGGTEWALDVAEGVLWAVPAMGRGAWENVTPIDTGDKSTVGLLLGDDVEAAPLYLYIGKKNAVGDNSFLDRNGLKVGKLYAWKADEDSSGSTPDDPSDFNGESSALDGTFVEVEVIDTDEAGEFGYDGVGYLNDDTLRARATDGVVRTSDGNGSDVFKVKGGGLGCFKFSRPEDLSTNPEDGTEVIFASTGRSALFGGADSWGTTYLIELSLGSKMTAKLTILHDADDRTVPDNWIRSPDNLVWAQDGYAYIQEDRSVSGFGAVSGAEASVWKLDPSQAGKDPVRIGEIDRSAVAPSGSSDSGAGDLGNWESSGVLDVTHLFWTSKGETLLIANVQAHGIRDGVIADEGLVQGGQIIFLSNRTSEGNAFGKNKANKKK